MVGVKLSKKDFLANKKAINIVFPIIDIERIILVAEYRRIPVTTLIKAIVCEAIEREADTIRRSKYVPIAQRGGDLFGNVVQPVKRKMNKKEGKK